MQRCCDIEIVLLRLLPPAPLTASTPSLRPHPRTAVIICTYFITAPANKSMDHVEGVYDAIGTSSDDMANFLCGGSLYDALDDPTVNIHPMDDTAAKKALLMRLADEAGYTCGDASMAGYLSNVHSKYDALLSSVTDIIDSSIAFRDNANTVADSAQVRASSLTVFLVLRSSSNMDPNHVPCFESPRDVPTFQCRRPRSGYNRLPAVKPRGCKRALNARCAFNLADNDKRLPSLALSRRR